MRLHFTRILHIHGFELHKKRISWPLKHSWRRSYEASKARDGISIVLVLFGLGLYGSSCYYGIWALIYVALGCIVLGVVIAVRTQRCPFCHRYLGMMFFTGKKTYCPHCGSDVRAGRNV